MLKEIIVGGCRGSSWHWIFHLASPETAIQGAPDRPAGFGCGLLGQCQRR